MNPVRLLFLGGFLFLACAMTNYAQEIAPNDIPVPWYSQKITGCPYTHCSLTASLMVFDYYKGMTSDIQRTAKETEEKLVEYQRDYFMKKKAPFRHRTSLGQGSYYAFEIDSLTRYYENMAGAEHFHDKDYKRLKKYIDEGTPVLVNIKHKGTTSGPLVPGNHRHWVVLRGMTDEYVWINDPGRSASMRIKAENKRYPIKKQKNNPSYFDGCWTGRYIVITPGEWFYEKKWGINSLLQIDENPTRKELKPHMTPLDIQLIK